MIFDLLRLTIDEAWALRDYVRQHDKLGQEWDKDFMGRVHAAIIEAKAYPGHDVSLMVDDEELWQIDRQIPGHLMVGTQAVGRSLLLKAALLLQKMERNDEDKADAGTGENPGEIAPRSSETTDASGGDMPITA